MSVIISEDQNQLEHKSKTYVFVPSPSVTLTADDCEYCDLSRTDACNSAPCMSKYRIAKNHGYFQLKK